MPFLDNGTEVFAHPWHEYSGDFNYLIRGELIQQSVLIPNSLNLAFSKGLTQVKDVQEIKTKPLVAKETPLDWVYGEPLDLSFYAYVTDHMLLQPTYDLGKVSLEANGGDVYSVGLSGGNVNPILGVSEYKQFSISLTPEDIEGIIEADINGVIAKGITVKYKTNSGTDITATRCTPYAVSTSNKTKLSDFSYSFALKSTANALENTKQLAWQKQDPSAAFRSVSAAPLGPVAASVDASSNVRASLALRNCNKTNPINITSVKVTVLTPSTSLLSGTAKPKVLNDFIVKVDDVDIGVFSSTTKTHTFNVDLASLETISVEVTFAPTLKLIPVAGNFTSFNIATATPASTAINAARRISLQFYQGTTPVGDPLIVSGSVI